MGKHKLKSCKKIILTFLLCSLLLHITTGCWDRRELEERISVVGIAIDKAEPSKGGEPMYKVTLQIPIPIQIAGAGGGGGGGGGIESTRIISSTGFTVANTFSNLQKRLNQQLFFGHTRVIAISKEVAREGVTEILDGFRRDPSIRRLLWFMVVDGQASKLLTVDPKLEQIPIVYIMTLIENGTKMGNIPDVTLGRFYIAETTKAKQPIVNYVKTGKEDVSWTGVALFNREKMVGHFDSKNTWILMQLREDEPGGDFVIYSHKGDKKEHVVIRPKQLETKVKTNVKNGKVTADYLVYIQANIIEEHSKRDLSSSSVLKELEHKAEAHFEEKAKSVIKLLQEKYKVDSLDLGAKIKAHHYDEWEKMNWFEEFPNAEVTVKYRVEFRRIGMKMK